MKNLINFRTFESNDNRIFEAANPVKGEPNFGTNIKKIGSLEKAGCFATLLLLKSTLKIYWE